MDFRKSFSKPFKKLKDKVRGDSREGDGRSGSEDSRKWRGVDATEGEASKSSPYLHPEASVEGAVKSGPSREGNNVSGRKAAQVDDVDHPRSAPLISDIRELDSR